MAKCPTCGNEIVEIRGHQLDNWEALAPAHADDQLELLITAELPGVDEKDLEIKVSGENTLTIRGQMKVEREEDGDDGLRSFCRSIRLPFEVKEERIDATLDDGVLSVRVRKLPVGRKSERSIKVKRSGNGREVGEDPARRDFAPGEASQASGEGSQASWPGADRTSH
jgi:HSP20 family molecular chaperone IbpA